MGFPCPFSLQYSFTSQFLQLRMRSAVRVAMSIWPLVLVTRVIANPGGEGLTPGVEVRLVVWIHLDVDLGHRWAWWQVLWGSRVSGGNAHLGVSGWGGAGYLQVQSDSEEQGWNSPGYTPVSLLSMRAHMHVRAHTHTHSWILARTKSTTKFRHSGLKGNRVLRRAGKNVQKERQVEWRSLVKDRKGKIGLGARVKCYNCCKIKF